MIYVQADLFRRAAVAVADPKSGSPHFEGVFIERHPIAGAVLVATDRHRMIVAHDPEGEASETGAIIRVDKALLKACAPGRKDPPRHIVCSTEHGLAVVDTACRDDAADALASLSSPRAIHRVAAPLIDATYPNWRRVVPTTAGKSDTMAVNGDYVASLASALCDEGKGVRLYDCGGRMYVVHGGRADIFGLLMGLRWDHGDDMLPDWM